MPAPLKTLEKLIRNADNPKVLELNINPKPPQTRCLTIGGSDGSGGAGIEADLAIFRDAGLVGCNVITALTAQTAHTIHRIEPVPCSQIGATLDAAVELQPIAAIKTGMLVDRERVQMVADRVLHDFPDTPLIVDPVLVASSGRRLLSSDAVTTLCANLLPLATVITPNLDEAALLLGDEIGDCQAAAIALARRFDAAILLKGGHGRGERVTETLAMTSGEVMQWHFPRQQLTTEQAHGTGCRTASAIAAAIALDIPLKEAIPLAHRAAIDGCWQRD